MALISYRQYTVRDGLPNLTIETLYADRSGTLWIGTHGGGLVQCDGDVFRSFARVDGISGHGVFSIQEDAQGHLYLGTNKGLTRYDGQTFSLVEGTEAYSFLWGACADSTGALWFGLERRPGLPPAVMRVVDGMWELLELPSADHPIGRSIHCIAEDAQGAVWFGGWGLFCWDGTPPLRWTPRRVYLCYSQEVY